MAASEYSGTRRSGGRAGAGRYRPMSENNVTPLVDVMLVLLVVFMVTAPLLTVGVPVRAAAGPRPRRSTSRKEPLVITLNRDGVIFIQETSVPVESLIARLQAITGSNPDAVLYVRGDKGDQLRPGARGDEPGQRRRFSARCPWSLKRRGGRLACAPRRRFRR